MGPPNRQSRKLDSSMRLQPVGARAHGGPARVRRVAHTMAAGVKVTVPCRCCRHPRAQCLCGRCGADRDPRCPDDLSPFMQEIRVTEGDLSAPDDATECSTRARRNRCPLRRALRGHEHDCDEGADHRTPVAWLRNAAGTLNAFLGHRCSSPPPSVGGLVSGGFRVPKIQESFKRGATRRRLSGSQVAH